MTQFALYQKNRIDLRALRPRQASAIEAVRQAVREGHKRIILQAPTGAGKTLIAAHLIAGSIVKGKRPIFTCPAITLVEQTLHRFEDEGILDIGVIQAQHERTDWSAQVQIASVQTLIRRALPEVDLILIDEVHENFDGLNERLDSPEWADKVAIGLSATPWSRGMGLRWTKLIIAATIDELIEDGHLSPFRIYVPEHDVNRRSLKVRHGEFTEQSSSEAMQSAVIVGDVVKTWKEKWGQGKTFLFCVNRAHAQLQMQAFTDSGIPFGYIDALTPIEQRTRIFQKMQYGEYAGIASVGCLIRGVDEDVRCIIDAQPTRSEMRHVQKWGRGLRTADGKECLIGLDHAGNTLALGMVTEIFHDRLDVRKPSEKGEAYEDERKPPKPKQCPRCRAIVKAGAIVCIVCGEKMPRKSNVTEREGELIELGSGKKEPAVSHAEKQEFYSGFLAIAQERGNSEGWAAHRYREKFGVWPRGLVREARPVTARVRSYDKHLRIKYAKSREAVTA